MRWASRAILGLWRIEATDAVKTVFTAEELAGLVGQARTEGLLDAEEHARITAALALSERTARDALRPWAEVVTVAEDVSPAALEVLATRTRRSRFPVVERASRRVVLGRVGPQRRAAIPRELIRPLAVVPPERTLADLLLAMRRERRHLVLVSGGRTPLGVVSLDDVLNAVVGKPVTGRVTPTRTATG
jgi:CBS domain containing-hemolysin-like protein